MLTTFLNESEIDAVPPGDAAKHLNKVRELTGENWQMVREIQWKEKKKWLVFNTIEDEETWRLYLYVGGAGPWALMRSNLIESTAYLAGIVDGFECKTRQVEKEAAKQPSLEEEMQDAYDELIGQQKNVQFS